MSPRPGWLPEGLDPFPVARGKKREKGPKPKQDMGFTSVPMLWAFKGSKGKSLSGHQLPGGSSLNGCRQLALGDAPRNQSLCSPRNSRDSGALPQPWPTLEPPA